MSAYYPWNKSVGRAPFGTAVATSIVTDQGTVTFTGLLSGTIYTAYALVGTRHQYLDFETEPADEPDGSTDLTEVMGDIAELGTRVSALETGGPTFPDASTSTKGSVKLSSAPADAANPIAVGDNDSRIVQVADHETRIDALESASGDTAFGKETVGATPSVIGSNVKMVNQFTVPADGQISYIDVYLDGNGGGGGSQNFRGVIYSDTGANPDVLLASSSTVVVAAGAAGAWIRFTFAVPVAVTLGQAIWMGWHSGTSGNVGRYYLDGGGAQRYNTDLFTDGAASPFGSATTVGQTLSVKSVVQDNAASRISALEFDIEALEDADVTIDGRLDALEAGGGSTGSGVTKTVVANFPFPASAVVESDPIETGTEGTMIIAGAAGDQTITSVQVMDSLDGTTWRAHTSAATVVNRPYAKVKLTNGGTVQGDSELSMATA